MKKRLRKKLHVGEFAVFGVSLRVSFKRSLSLEDHHALCDSFIADAIERHGFQFGGGFSEMGFGGVVELLGHRGEALEPAIERLRRWLHDQPEMGEVEISAPWDLSHGKDPFDPL